MRDDIFHPILRQGRRHHRDTSLRGSLSHLDVAMQVLRAHTDNSDRWQTAGWTAACQTATPTGLARSEPPACAARSRSARRLRCWRAGCFHRLRRTRRRNKPTTAAPRPLHAPATHNRREISAAALAGRLHRFPSGSRRTGVLARRAPLSAADSGRHDQICRNDAPTPTTLTPHSKRQRGRVSLVFRHSHRTAMREHRPPAGIGAWVCQRSAGIVGGHREVWAHLDVANVG